VLPPKKDVALALLERSQVFIHLDPRQKGVVVPTHFRKQAQLVLQIGLEMPIPIPDLEIDDAGIGCTLSFNRAPFHCSLPWTAIFALVGDDGRGMVWPEDVPPEVSSQAQARQPPSKRPRKAPEAAPARPKRGKAAAEASDRDVRTKLAIVPDALTAAEPAATPMASAPSAASTPSAASAGSAADDPEKIDDAPPPPDSPRKPKRELPPYLRVVK
jgi:stringent starvation protein B